MHKKPKPAQRVTVAWECQACGARHLWKWNREDVGGSWRITMRCDTCDAETPTYLTRIGHNVWAAEL